MSTLRTRRVTHLAPAGTVSALRLGGVVEFGAFTSQLDTSVVKVGLASIARVLSASLGTVQWVTNTYLMALAVGLPLCG